MCVGKCNFVILIFLALKYGFTCSLWFLKLHFFYVRNVIIFVRKKVLLIFVWNMLHQYYFSLWYYYVFLSETQIFSDTKMLRHATIHLLLREIIVENIIVKFWLNFSKNDYYEFNLLWLLNWKDKTYQRLTSRRSIYRRNWTRPNAK